MFNVIDMNISTKDVQKGDLDNRSKHSITKPDLKEEISKLVVRKKLAKQRHLVIKEGISPEYLDSLFPSMLTHFDPQTVTVSLIFLYSLLRKDKIIL